MSEDRIKPLGVIFISVLMFLSGIIWWLAGLAWLQIIVLWLVSYNPVIGSWLTSGVISLIWGSLSIVVSIGLYNLKEWAHAWGIGITVLGLFWALLTLDVVIIIMGILILVYLSLRGEEFKVEQYLEEE